MKKSLKSILFKLSIENKEMEAVDSFLNEVMWLVEERKGASEDNKFKDKCDGLVKGLEGLQKSLDTKNNLIKFLQQYSKTIKHDSKKHVKR
jgi:hypothetical protein